MEPQTCRAELLRRFSIMFQRYKLSKKIATVEGGSSIRSRGQNRETTMMKKLLLTSIAALLLATGAAHAAGVDYICGHYSIVVEPKNRTYQSFDGSTRTTSTVTVTKGITINDDTSGDKRIVKKLPRNKNGKVAVHGMPCRKIY